MKRFCVVIALVMLSGASNFLIAEEVEVYGIVTLNGKPLKGIHLALSGRPNKLGATTSDANGKYSFGAVRVPPDKKFLKVELGMQSTDILKENYGEAEKVIELIAEREKYEVSLSFHRGLSLKGVLKAAGETPVANALIIPSCSLPTTSSRSGAFTLGGINPAEGCWITTICRGANNGLLIRVPPMGKPGDRKDIGEIRYPDVATRGISTIKGRFKSRSESKDSGINLIRFTELTHGWFWADVPRNDIATIENVIPGKYVISLKDSSAVAKDVELGKKLGVKFPDMLVLDVVPGENEISITISEIDKAWHVYDSTLSDAQTQP